jgi:lipopolysaccharide export system permease protein
MIKRLDRYLLRSFFTTLLVVGLAVGLTIVVVNMVEELRDFIDHQVPMLSILQYYLYFGGWVVKSFFPFFVLLATLFSISLLARRNELMAMKASGLSLYRLALPFILVAAVLSAMHFYYNEYIFPPANRKRLEIKEFTIERKSKEYFARARNIYRQVNPGTFYTISNFNISRREGQDFKLYKTAKNQLKEIITSKILFYNRNTWLAIDGVARYFDSSKQESFARFDTLTIPDIQEKPDDFAKPIGNPEDMGLVELRQYIDLMKRTGGPYRRETIDLQLKYSYPLTSLIVVFICIPFASNAKRSGIAVSIAGGAFIALIYFVLFRITQSAGYNGKISEVLAVWGVNGLFFLVGITLMISAKK